MKPEPLKKEDVWDINFAEGTKDGVTVERLASAVEWLKEELKRADDRPQYNKDWVKFLINKALSM